MTNDVDAGKILTAALSEYTAKMIDAGFDPYSIGAQIGKAIDALPVVGYGRDQCEDYTMGVMEALS